jgi:hypothetical protein
VGLDGGPADVGLEQGGERCCQEPLAGPDLQRVPIDWGLRRFEADLQVGGRARLNRWHRVGVRDLGLLYHNAGARGGRESPRRARGLPLLMC